MPFVLIVVGVLILVSALHGTSGALFSTLKSDFTGSDNFLYWVIAILVVGSIGYVKKFQPLSAAFLTLLLIVLFIANKGFFAQFQQGISGAASTSCTSGSSTSALSSMSNLFNVQGVAQTATTQNNATYQPGQSLATQLQNSITNLNNALGYGSGAGL
jgi:hypothetical protein